MAMKAIRDFVKKLGQKGQGIVEYALILAFVVGVAAYLTQSKGLGDAIQSVFTKATNQVNGTKTE